MIPEHERPKPSVPPVLATLAAWSWRVLLVLAMVYIFAMVVGRIWFVALPVAIAFLLTALLYPMTSRLRRAGLRPIYATWVTMLSSLAILIGIGFVIGFRANDEFPRLVEQIQLTARNAQDWLLHGPLQLKEAQLADIVDELTKQVNERRSEITGTLLSGATAIIEVLASIVLLLFVTFFLLKDGDRIWAWFLRAFGTAAPRVDRAGRAAWITLSHYVQGTVAVAAIHGVIIGIVLAGMRVPLWAPLAVLIFFASFIPIVGILFAGSVATLVTFGAQGWVYALIFVGVLVLEQQLENHVLQPLIVGRALEFHPLAIILVLAVGGVLGGIAGAAVAVPVVAVIYRALPELRAEPAALPPPAAMLPEHGTAGGPDRGEEQGGEQEPTTPAPGPEPGPQSGPQSGPASGVGEEMSAQRRR